MACRLAGMSDEEFDNEYETSFHEKPGKRSINNRSLRNGVDSPTLISNLMPPKDEQMRQEEQELQFSVIRACMTGNLEIIEEYIKTGHNVNDYLHTGWTLLLYGSSSCLPEVVELLLKHGAKPNKNRDGSTPLLEVCGSTQGCTDQCLQCISILIGAKANPNARNKLMKTALMLACQTKKAEVVAELLKHVKDVDAMDNEGRTALHYAALANKPETIKLLLEHNASRTIADRRDLTARDIAETKGFEKVIALLDYDDNGQVQDFCERTTKRTWSDLFPGLCGDTSAFIDSDIADVLYGMGLESYNSLFKGLDLNTFLKLTEEDLVKLGMDIALHRKQLVDNLHKFHTKAWSIRSIGSINQHLPYSLYDGVTLLGNAARQIGVIGSSFQFIKNGLKKARAKDSGLSDVEKTEYKKELRKTEETLLLLKKDLDGVMTLAKKVEKTNRRLQSAAYIGPKEKKYNWTIILGITIITGLYLSKTSFVQRLWNH